MATCAIAAIAMVPGTAPGTVESHLCRTRTKVTDPLRVANDNGANPETKPTEVPPPRRIPIAFDTDGGTR